MTTQSSPPWLAKLVRLSAISVIALGVLTLIGWALNIGFLKSVVPGWNMMKPNTAICFVLSGTGLLLFQAMTDKVKRGLRPSLKIVATVIMAISSITLLEHVGAVDFGIDRLLFSEKFGNAAADNNGLMSTLAALCFLFTGWALFIVEDPEPRRTYWVLTVLVTFSGLAVLTAYLYGANAVPLFRQMAIHTAAGFLVLGIGLRMVRADTGLLSMISKDSAAGLATRYLLPVCILIPIGVGWLRLQGQRLGWYGTEVGLLLFALANVILFTLFLWFSTERLRRKDEELTLASVAKNRLAAIVNSSDDAILSKTLDGIITSWNRGAEKLFGYTEAEAIGQPMLMLIPADRTHEERDILLRISSGEFIDHFETVRVCKDGSLVDISATISPLRNDFGQIVGASKIARDITEQRQAEKKIQERLNRMLDERTARLEESNRELEAFSYSVSHDLRQPLRAVTGYSRMLIEDYEPLFDEEGKRLIRQIQRSSLKMGVLIDELLSFSRIGRHAITPVVIDMEGLARSAAEELKKNESYQHAAVVVDPLPACMGDPSLFRLVWINLLSNALKFSHKLEQPSIQVCGHRVNGECVYSVKDNGAGFNMTYYNKLFGVFQRLHTEREFEGTGVGLAIVHRVVSRHNGRIWAESEENAGATFYFALPGVDASPDERIIAST